MPQQKRQRLTSDATSKTRLTASRAGPRTNLSLATRPSQGEPSNASAAKTALPNTTQAAGSQLRTATDSWDSLASQLSAGLGHFNRNRTKAQYQQWHQIDFALDISPSRAVGRRVRVYWPEDMAWYPGRITSYDASSQRHQIEYEDGDSEKVLLAAEKVRLLVVPCENLPQPAVKESVRLLFTAACVPREDSCSTEPNNSEHPQGVGARNAPGNGVSLRLARWRWLKPRLEASSTRSAAGNESSGRGKEGSNSAARYAGREEGNFLPGEVVWCVVKGWCHWPALVMTHPHLDELEVPGQHKATVPVIFFGTMQVLRARQPSLLGFAEGLRLQLPAKCRRNMPAFRRALLEVLTYLTQGKLPDGPMVPEHMDEPFLDEDSGKEAGAQLTSQPAAVIATAAGGASDQSPVILGKHLRVLSLGTIEWLHPAFHDEKRLWPPGYIAERFAATSASAGKAVPHRCEVVVAADGSGPLFRVTPQGSHAVEAPTVSAAWAALHRHPTPPSHSSHPSQSPADPVECTAGSNALLAADATRPVNNNSSSSSCNRRMCGAQAFGFTHPAVMKALQALPGTERCEHYCGWPSMQPRPPVPPLTAGEAHQRAMHVAHMQRLPAGITAVTIPQSSAACHVCNVEDETEDNILLQCDGCYVMVHQTCYGVAAAPNGRLWLCDVCKLGLTSPPPCCLCPVVGGALKPTTCDRWAHMACALWSPDPVGLEASGSRLEGIDQVSAARRKLLCTLCRQPYGACIQCAGSATCYVAFHALCARGARLVIATVDADASDNAENKNSNIIMGKPKARRKRRRVEGSCAGDGLRRLCFCPLHASKGRALLSTSTFSPSRAGSRPSLAVSQKTTAAAPQAVRLSDSTSSCARARPFESALRRGLRAPDFAAIAIAKRAYLQPAPGSISRRSPWSKAPIPQSQCFRSEAERSLACSISSRNGSEAIVRPVGIAAPGRQLCSTGGKQLPDSRHIKSQFQRFQEMVKTLHCRITVGKSTIHGYGAFAKVSHNAGDMVVEYVGEFVRRSVVGLRESREYDAACGPGTYVFGCSNGMCIDATRAGNIAHLLNHCCAPNCFSRLVKLNHGSEDREHIILFAKENIAAGEELCYDYRFAGEQKLPCNCGAAVCRGFVNEDRSAAGDALARVPLSELRPVKSSGVRHIM